MNITELHNLPTVEKVKIIEALRNDLVGDESCLPSLSWHETELKETEEKFQAGSLEVLDWQTSQERIALAVQMKVQFLYSAI